MDQARTNFQLKTKMVKNIKLNYKNDPNNVIKLWKCTECDYIDSQDHILWCEGYTELRNTKTLKMIMICQVTSRKETWHIFPVGALTNSSHC